MKKQSWIVKARKEILVEIITYPCTEEEALTEPDAHTSEERELECYSVDVVDCEANR